MSPALTILNIILFRTWGFEKIYESYSYVSGACFVFLNYAVVVLTIFMLFETSKYTVAHSDFVNKGKNDLPEVRWLALDEKPGIAPDKVMEYAL